MNESTKINDVLNNPLFKDIGQFLFPTDFYSISNNMTLKAVIIYFLIIVILK